MNRGSTTPWCCVGSAIVGVLGWAGIYAWQRPATDTRPTEQIVSATRLASGTASLSGPRLPSSDVTSPLPERSAGAMAPRSMSPQVEAIAPAQVCGFGSVDLAADDPYSLQRLPAPLRNGALDGAEASMRASNDEKVRAAALMIGARSGMGAAGLRTEQLARLAVASQSPEVYAMALEACKPSTVVAAGNCSLLSRAQWVRLDPDNAHPWLELAAEARSRQNAEAEGDAMQHAARARRIDTRKTLLSNLVDKALGPNVPLLGRTLALAAAWSAQTAWEPSHSAQVAAYCSKDAIVDPNRHETCQGLAQMLSQLGTSLEDLRLSLMVGKSLSWAEPRLQAMQQEHDAIREAGGADAIGVDFSCNAVERIQAWMRQVGAHGEMQTLRDRLARSGRSATEWSAQSRRNFAVATAAAESVVAQGPARASVVRSEE